MWLTHRSVRQFFGGKVVSQFVVGGSLVLFGAQVLPLHRLPQMVMEEVQDPVLVDQAVRQAHVKWRPHRHRYLNVRQSHGGFIVLIS